ncbi:MAG: hypothetical protein ACJ762_02830 [Solirubrobacteraceae bacterium]
MGGDYDAFGRKTGEDPLGDLGWRGEAAGVEPDQAAPEPKPRADPGTEPDSEIGATFEIADRVAQMGGRMVRRFVVLVTLVVIGAAGLAVFGSVETDTSTGGGSVVETSTAAEPAGEAPEPEAVPPTGLGSRSLLRPGAFAKAMARLRSRGLGQVANLRLAPDRIDAQLLTAGGRLRDVQIQAGQAVHELSISGPGFGHLESIAYSAIDAKAPARFARSAARPRHRPVARIDYLVLLKAGDEIIWSLFFKDGTHFTADAHGRIT